ncbi:hypothetical protein S4054249_07215 [Pseudoalteromonas luteoviolacea]|uniref:Uncharacterized protein n=2 Tax=Pseudoalteromonas luteoviolacea TaxID=43657 RepID=A0A0F6A6D6_9GAMM|nr:hypothetical protein S4054249_07215 [Pseudoalteromonas luteoviolacea]AOT12559.1 hypothetical protein S40542_07215 [Pseudoalteromonas luteoviolacea]AOT17473.1 hypothetical protein S4054_07215 [Pseudoalteromonas luteoviolacea]KKE81386.1 hypothetical protein N479_22900 [Pseudoalteromonas luteoviolacea S4054]
MNNRDNPLKFKSLDTATNSELERLTRGVIDTCDIAPLSRFDLNAAMDAESKDLQSRCDDYKNGFAEVRARRQISDTVPDEHIQDQIVTLPCGALWLAGIYRNHQDQTLIEIIGERTVEFSELQRYLPDILSFFSWCQPEIVSVWSKPHSEHFKLLANLHGAEVEDCFWGAETTNIDIPKTNEITLAPFNMTADWRWYEQEYQTFHHDVPHLKERLEIEETESVAELVEKNLAFIAYLTQQPTQKVGVVLLEPCTELGYKGLLINEFIIAKAFRGRGFGPKIQAAIIDKIRESYDFVCGYIYSGNHASMNNAKYTRSLLRTEITLPIEHFITPN